MTEGTAPLVEACGLARSFLVRRGPFARPARLHAVGGIDFTLRAGRTLALVGESGCGKSTTARLVLGMLAPSAGEVRFEGRSVPSARDGAWRELRRAMQLVPQDPLAALDPRIRVGEQVAEPARIFGEADGPARVLELFDAVGLNHELAQRFPHELSGGQRQRVVLARALMLRPRLLVCDEPVSALDVSIQAQVVNLLLSLQERMGLAYLFITHDLKLVRHVAHEVAVMYLGRIVEQGPPELVFAEPRHPYTRALVGAVPTPARRGGQGRVLLRGDPPSPIALPAGCAFRGRCERAGEGCDTARPDLRQVGPERWVACHHPILIRDGDIGPRKTLVPMALPT